jgi:hypothetical protein
MRHFVSQLFMTVISVQDVVVVDDDDDDNDDSNLIY